MSSRGLSQFDNEKHRHVSLGDCFALAGNRTRASRVAGENSTTEPPVPRSSKTFGFGNKIVLHTATNANTSNWITWKKHKVASKLKWNGAAPSNMWVAGNSSNCFSSLSSYVYLCSKFMCHQFYERYIDFAKQEPHHFLREMQRKNNSLVFCT